MWAGTKAYGILPPAVALFHVIGEGAPVLLATGAVALPFTLIGAMFPDLDAKRSIPFRHFRRGVAIFTGGVIATVLYVNRGLVINVGELLPVTTSPTFVGGTIYGVGVIGAGWMIFRFLYVYNPPHRGILHQIPAGLLVSIILFSIVSSVAVSLSISNPAALAFLVGTSFFIGYLSHLYLDTDPQEEKSLLLLRKTYIGERLDDRLP